MAEIPDIPVQIVANLEQLNTTFADVISVEATPDIVYLNFLQSFPSGSTPDVSPEVAEKHPPAKVAKVVSRIALSWPHFARIAVVLNETLKDNRDQAKETFTNFVFNDKI